MPRNNSFLVKVCVFICVVGFVELIPVSEKTGSEYIDENSSTAIAHRKFDKILKFKGWMLVPMLLGGLLKVAATVPLILAVAAFIGTLSFISSKISLLLSLFLAAKSFMKPMMPEPKDPAALSLEDIHELQFLLAKQAEKHSAMANLVQINPEVEQANYWKPPDPVAWNRKYYTAPRQLYLPENYFMTTPSADVSPNIMLNNKNMNEIIRVAGAHAAAELEETRDKKWSENKNSLDEMKILASAEMAARANALLDSEALKNPNRRVGVKVTKTVTRTKT